MGNTVGWELSLRRILALFLLNWTGEKLRIIQEVGRIF
jgi:hypothetical protein